MKYLFIILISIFCSVNLYAQCEGDTSVVKKYKLIDKQDFINPLIFNYLNKYLFIVDGKYVIENLKKYSDFYTFFFDYKDTAYVNITNKIGEKWGSFKMHLKNGRDTLVFDYRIKRDKEIVFISKFISDFLNVVLDKPLIDKKVFVYNIKLKKNIEKITKETFSSKCELSISKGTLWRISDNNEIINLNVDFHGDIF